MSDKAIVFEVGDLVEYAEDGTDLRDIGVVIEVTGDYVQVRYMSTNCGPHLVDKQKKLYLEGLRKIA
jgi:hypothetical protein